MEFEFGPALTRFLDSLPARPRLLGLGEPTHGPQEFLRLRNRMFRSLVEREGYRSIALETDVLAAQVVDEYVAGGPGDLDEVMSTGFSHGFGAAAGNRELVAWMREYNAACEPAERLRFDGFDAPLELESAPSPRGCLAALRDHLAARVEPDLLPAGAPELERLAGADGRWSATEAVLDASRSVGDTPDARALRLLADDLTALLATQAPGLVAAASTHGSPPAWRQARLHARTAVGLLRYHAILADPREIRIARASAQRDAMMADNLLDIVEREAERGPTLAFAHNLHLQREPSTMTMGGVALQWWSAAAIAGTALQDGYAFVATALGAAPERGLGAPASGTLEGLLVELGAGLYPADDLRGRDLAPRPGDWWYFPLHPDHLAGAGAVLFVPEA